MIILYPQIKLSPKEKKYCRENNIEEKELLIHKRYEKRIICDNQYLEELLHSRGDIRIYDRFPYGDEI